MKYCVGVVVATSAPKAYDYSFTVETGEAETILCGKPVSLRTVIVIGRNEAEAAMRLTIQTERYQSGLFGWALEENWEERGIRRQ